MTQQASKSQFRENKTLSVILFNSHQKSIYIEKNKTLILI